MLRNRLVEVISSPGPDSARINGQALNNPTWLALAGNFLSTLHWKREEAPWRVARPAMFSFPATQLRVPRRFDSAQVRLLRSLPGRVRCCSRFILRADGDADGEAFKTNSATA